MFDTAFSLFHTSPMMISSHLGGSLILLKTVEDTSVLLTCSLASHNPKEPLQKSVTANIGNIFPSRLRFFQYSTGTRASTN